MRPQILFPLFTPVTALPGLGPRLAPLVEKAAGDKVVDLLWHLPTGIIDRRFSPSVADAPPGRIATLTVTVETHQPGATRRQPYRIYCADKTGTLILTFFHAKPDYLLRSFPPGEVRVVSGTVESYRGAKQMTHPDHVGTVEEWDSLASVEPIYRLTAGLTLKVVTKAVRAALGKAPRELPEWADPALVARNGWPAWREALDRAHAPESERDLDPGTPARTRLAYDELLANQLAILLVRAQQRRLKGRSIKGDGVLRDRALSRLPFKLTGAQRLALAEIEGDMAATHRMLRLLQGDVGSGKTVVAFLAMLNAVETGAQAALMAPTEILARQHFETISKFAQSSGVKAALLTGRDKGKTRTRLLELLARGDIDILVGTHALFSQDVAFKDLAVVVVDEQHRFGVHQRMALSEKGLQPDILVMTATPIPRTLLLAVYGDLESSRLDEKPPGRQPVDTRVLPVDKLPEIVDGIARAIDGGAQAYWVCPLVEESETSDLADVTYRQKQLQQRFGDTVGLVHGRMKAAEKDAAMARFSAGETRLLISTTVIEVGVDVPNATVMVVEHAERFGLSQLHQLRGRIGRGSGRSTCLLLYQGPLGETARARLNILRETEDGFRIAEEDLRLRGGGEILGARQSGLPTFRLAVLPAHEELLALARDDARLALDRDPRLESDRGQALRTLLYLFERDEGVRLLRSG